MICSCSKCMAEMYPSPDIRIKELQAQLAASQERERILREGLGEYAQTRNWAHTEMNYQYRNWWMRWENGYDIAERTIKAAEEVKGCTGK